MVFTQSGKYGLTFTVCKKQTDGSLCRETAAKAAKEKFSEAGVSPSKIIIEAFESLDSWLIFCVVSEEEQYAIYINFQTPDDFLDAISIFGAKDIEIRGWKANGFTAQISGERQRVKDYTKSIREFGRVYEAPIEYSRHLEEHYGEH